MGDEKHQEAELVRVTLDAPGVDLLELVRLGALPPSALHRYLTAHTSVLLCDEENTPLSELSTTEVTHLRPLAMGVGPAWGHDVRQPVTAIAQLPTPRVALFSRLPPSNAEVDELIARVTAIGARSLLLCALVSRSHVSDGEVQPSGLLRALRAVADTIAHKIAPCQITLLAIPWPQGLVDPRDLARTYGATEMMVGADTYSADAPHGYPPGSASEINRARASSVTRGAVVLFTGLSGSGKSTIAAALAELLRDDGARGVTLLDGDAMRRSMSAGLGFDRASRNLNLQRIGVAAAGIAGAGGIAIAAPIAPFAEGRALARNAAAGHPFLLVHICTPLEICEQRDRKGLYAKARAGEIAEFTGISSPYEAPDDADLVIDASALSVAEAALKVKDALEKVAR